MWGYRAGDTEGVVKKGIVPVHNYLPMQIPPNWGPYNFSALFYQVTVFPTSEIRRGNLRRKSLLLESVLPEL